MCAPCSLAVIMVLSAFGGSDGYRSRVLDGQLNPKEEQLRRELAAIALTESDPGQEQNVVWIYYNRWKSQGRPGLNGSVAYRDRGDVVQDLDGGIGRRHVCLMINPATAIHCNMRVFLTMSAEILGFAPWRCHGPSV